MHVQIFQLVCILCRNGNGLMFQLLEKMSTRSLFYFAVVCFICSLLLLVCRLVLCWTSLLRLDCTEQFCGIAGRRSISSPSGLLWLFLLLPASVSNQSGLPVLLIRREEAAICVKLLAQCTSWCICLAQSRCWSRRWTMEFLPHTKSQLLQEWRRATALFTMTGSWVSYISKKFIGLGIQNNLPHGRNGTQHCQYREYYGYGGVQPKKQASLWRFEGDVIHNWWHCKIKGQEPKSTNGCIEGTKEREHRCYESCYGDG